MSSKSPVWASQNLLTSSAYIRRMLSRVGLVGSDRVVEIGPGKGHITAELLRLCGEVTAVEIDSKYYGLLKEKFRGNAALSLTLADFMSYRLPARGRYKVVGNIPFALTADIVRKLCRADNPPHETLLIVERGAAIRLCSHNAPDYLRRLYRGEIAYFISREEFHPRPRCDAALIRLKLRHL